jgi:hypothetical protein
VPNSSSSLLRPGSRFKGSQTSDRQQYEVEVEVKHVDMRESFMCGYLRIKGTQNGYLGDIEARGLTLWQA